MEELQEQQKYIDLPITTKAYNFWMLKKSRFFWVFLFLIWYQYGSKFSNWYLSKKQKVKKKYLNRWEHKYAREDKIYPTMFEGAAKMTYLSEDSQNKIGQAMVQLETDLPVGASRQLIVLGFSEINRITDKMKVQFLRDSGYQTTAKQVMCSCSLSELYGLFETVLEKIDNGKSREENEAELVDGWCKAVIEQKEKFEKNAQQMIEEMNRIKQEQMSGKKKKKEQEAKDEAKRVLDLEKQHLKEE